MNVMLTDAMMQKISEPGLRFYKSYIFATIALGLLMSLGLMSIFTNIQEIKALKSYS